MKRLLVFLALVLVAVLVALAVQQERYTYQRKQQPDASFYYVEIYETRDQDLDSTTQVTTQRRETVIDRALKVAELTAQRQALVDQAQSLQSRINAINALP